MSGILTAVESTTGGGTPKCTITIDPPDGDTPLTVSLSGTPSTAHIFYTKHTPPVNPTHAGDSATGITNRIGSNAGSVNIGASSNFIRALAYAPGYLDSDIAEGSYTATGGGG